jgi:hypothetical protein
VTILEAQTMVDKRRDPRLWKESKTSDDRRAKARRACHTAIM